MYIQKWCGIELFAWEDWDEPETGHLSFYNVSWKLKSMEEKYNGIITSVVLSVNGTIEIYKEDEINPDFIGYVSDISEVREKLGLLHSAKEIIEYSKDLVIVDDKEKDGANILIKILESKFLNNL